jgi:hypothetical protein
MNALKSIMSSWLRAWRALWHRQSPRPTAASKPAGRLATFRPATLPPLRSSGAATVKRRTGGVRLTDFNQLARTMKLEQGRDSAGRENKNARREAGR